MKKENIFIKTRIIAMRALQLSFGVPPLVKNPSKDPVETAKKEYEEKVIPIKAKE